jgi:hypothetical protein
VNGFYAYIDNLDWNNGISKFYPSIEEAVLDGNDYGEIEYYKSWGGLTRVAQGINPDMNTVPVRVAGYNISTIELYELAEFMKDEPELNERNCIVFTRGDENYEGMLTIVSLK